MGMPQRSIEIMQHAGRILVFRLLGQCYRFKQVEVGGRQMRPVLAPNETDLSLQVPEIVGDSGALRISTGNPRQVTVAITKLATFVTKGSDVQFQCKNLLRETFCLHIVIRV